MASSGLTETPRPGPAGWLVNRIRHRIAPGPRAGVWARRTAV